MLLLFFLAIKYGLDLVIRIKNIFSEYRTQQNSIEMDCTCNYKLGINQIANHDVKESESYENRFKFVNEEILLLGASNSEERCTLKDLFDNLKNKISDYYFDDKKKVIAIPNQMKLPDRPKLIKDSKDKYMDQYFEDKLHIGIVNATRSMDKHAFIFETFMTASYGLSLKLKKCKQSRDSMECDMVQLTGRKYNCAELNDHEKEVMRVLEINHIGEDELRKCIECHKKLLHDDNKVENKSPQHLAQVSIILLDF